MDKREAKTILSARLAEYRHRAYTDLQKLLATQETCEGRGDSGTAYQLEFYALWDDKPCGNLRVFGCIDDGGIRASFPLTECFIVAPDGRFIGEDPVAT